MEEYEILGYAYAGYFKTRAAYDWACEVSIYVREDMKRSGTGRRLYEALELCLAAMGMRNRWYDMCWMEKFLVPQETEVKPVVPFPEICEETDLWK